MCCGTGYKEPDVDSASNASIKPDIGYKDMSDNELTAALLQSLIKERPVTLSGKNPTLVDARAMITADFVDADDLWKTTAPKKVVSR